MARRKHPRRCVSPFSAPQARSEKARSISWDARHDRFEIVALTAQSNATELAVLARRHRARLAVIGDESQLAELCDALAGTGIRAAAGIDALIEAALMPADCVMAAIVGAAGLRPTFAAASRGARIALANKECLVSAGHVFTAEIERSGAELLPVDSEHSAAFQALSGADPKSIEKIVLTASGGPFRTWTREALEAATPEQALKHPNWSMGAKVTIDSATLMNKGLELIEAFHLFPVSAEALDCVVHPQSIVHCLVSYVDGSVLAQMAPPDMRTPIAVALAWPKRMAAPTEKLDLARLGSLTFEAPDETRFPALAGGECRFATRRYGACGAECRQRSRRQGISRSQAQISGHCHARSKRRIDDGRASGCHMPGTLPRRHIACRWPCAPAGR